MTDRLKAVDLARILLVGRGLSDYGGPNPQFTDTRATWVGGHSKLGPELSTLPFSSLDPASRQRQPTFVKISWNVWPGIFSQCTYYSGTCNIHANIISDLPDGVACLDDKQDFGPSEYLCTQSVYSPPCPMQLTWENKTYLLTGTQSLKMYAEKLFYRVLTKSL